MKKIKPPTYAERANRIIKKYPRAKWDKIEQNDLLKELRALKAEQEATKPLMEIADKADEMDKGVITPGGRPDQSFGPVGPYGPQDTNDPRFQKWAENVPGMGGYSVDPTQLPNLGPAIGVDPRKMSMAEYKRDIRDFAIGGGVELPWIQSNFVGNLPDGPASHVTTYDNSFTADGSNPRTSGMSFNQWKDWAKTAPYSSISVDSGLNNPSPAVSTITSTPTAPTGAAGQTAPIQGYPPGYELAMIKGIANANAPQKIDTAPLMQGLKDKGVLQRTQEAGLTTPKSTFGLPTVSAFPQIASLASSLLGDIAQIRNLNKMRTNVDLGRVTPQTIDLEPQRQAATRMFQQNRNSQLRAMRDAGMRTFDTSALADQYGTQMGKSYMDEQNANAQLRQQAGQTNAQLAAQEAQLNNQLANQRIAGMSGIIDSMSSALPMALKDYRQQVTDQNMVNIMGNDYGSFVKMMENPTLRDRLMKMFNTQQQYVLPREYVNNQRG